MDDQTEQQQDNREDGKTTLNAPDGKCYRRILKREPLTADEWLTHRKLASGSFFHWCNTQSPERLTVETPSHVCDVWELAHDAEAAQTSETRKRRRPPRPTFQDLIERVLYTQEETAVDPVPLLRRVEVIAGIYQAEALKKAADNLEEIRHNLAPLVNLVDLAEDLANIRDQLEKLNNRPIAQLTIPPSGLAPRF